MGEKNLKLQYKTSWNSAIAILYTVLGTDKRSLAVFRIFLALATIGDVLNRWTDIRAHYSDSGVMPRTLVLSSFTNEFWVSVHMMGGSDLFQSAIFFLHCAFSFMMLIGYYTKTSTFLTWFMVTSLHTRNIIVLHGGDILHRQLLFFGLFMPLGECYSIDRAYFSNPKPYNPNKHRFNYFAVISVATFGLAVQYSLMYTTSYIHKTGKEWTTDGTSTWLALQLDFFRTSIGDFFLLFPSLLKPLTHAVLWWEGFGFVFLFFPIFAGPVRTLGVLGFFMMHLGFGATLRLGQFALVALFGLCALFPTWFWEVIVFSRLRTKERLGFRFYYNPSYAFTTNLSIALENFFLIPETTVARLDQANDNQGDYGKRDDDVTVTLEITTSNRTDFLFSAQDFRGNQYKNFEAIVAAFKVSPLLWPLYKLLMVRSVYQFFKGLFHIYLRSLKPLPYTPRKPVTRRTDQMDIIKEFLKYFKIITSNVVCLVALIYIFSWNANNVGFSSLGPPREFRWIGWAFHLDQSWAMFSPRPPSVLWSYIIQAHLDNGTEVELFRNEGLFKWEPNPMSWTKPDPFWRSFKNHRWFKFWENGINSHKENEQLRLNLGRYICREFNSRHSGPYRVHRFALYWMSERVDAEHPEAPRVDNGRQALWNHQCYEKPSQVLH